MTEHRRLAAPGPGPRMCARALGLLAVLAASAPTAAAEEPSSAAAHWQCSAAADCETCRAAGCGWCGGGGADGSGTGGSCVPDAPGSCGSDDAELGFAGPAWMCPQDFDQGKPPEDALDECLMMGQLASGGRPLGATAARVGSAGWLLLRKEKKWRKLWCEIDGAELACRRHPAHAAVVKAIGLGQCTAVAPGGGGGGGGGGRGG
eukprot:SAG22_NODE_2247_length_2793_cov_2.069414_1_plen_204_part_10